MDSKDFDKIYKKYILNVLINHTKIYEKIRNRSK